jgi:hypothetical protein
MVCNLPAVRDLHDMTALIHCQPETKPNEWAQIFACLGGKRRQVRLKIAGLFSLAPAASGLWLPTGHLL